MSDPNPAVLAPLLSRSRRIAVGPVLVNFETNEVDRDGRRLRLTPKVAAVLEVLIHYAGRPVSKEQLLAEVWRSESPGDDVVTAAIKELRRALGDDARAPRLIRTLPKIGYELIAPVAPTGEQPAVQLDPARAAPAVPVEAPPAQPAHGRWRLPVAVLVAIGLTLAAWPLLRESPPVAPRDVAPRSEGAFEAVPITSSPGAEIMPAISPNGILIAYSQINPNGRGSRLLVKQVKGGNPIAITDGQANDELRAAFSPDGNLLVFERRWQDRCDVVVAAALGGNERVVKPCRRRQNEPIEWLPDGSGLVFGQQSGGGSVLSVLDLSTGAIRPLDYPRQPGDVDAQPIYSPRGDRIAFRRGMRTSARLMIMNADGSDLHAVTEQSIQLPGFDWTPDGQHLVFGSNETGRLQLWAVGADGRDRRPIGVQDTTWPSFASRADVLVYTRTEQRIGVARIRLDGTADEQPEVLMPSSRDDMWPTLSPDGRQIAFASQRSGRWGVWLTVDDREAVLLAEHKNAFTLSSLVWAPDGTRLAYLAQIDGSGRAFEVDVATRHVRTLSDPQRNTDMVAYADAGNALLLGIEQRDGWITQKIVPDGDSARVIGTLAPLANAHRVIEIAPDTWLLQTRSYDGLYRVDARGGRRQLTEAIQFWNRNAWGLRAGRLHAAFESGEVIGLFDAPLPTDGSPPDWQLLDVLPNQLSIDFSIDISNDRGSALLPLRPRLEGDVYAIQGIGAALSG